MDRLIATEVLVRVIETGSFSAHPALTVEAVLDDRDVDLSGQ